MPHKPHPLRKKDLRLGRRVRRQWLATGRKKSLGQVCAEYPDPTRAMICAAKSLAVTLHRETFDADQRAKLNATPHLHGYEPEARHKQAMQAIAHVENTGKAQALAHFSKLASS